MNNIYTSNAPAPIGPYSQAVWCGQTLYCSGQIAICPQTGDFAGTNAEAQTRLVLDNVGAVLKAAGLGFEDVVKTTCFLTSMDDFPAFNQVYAQYFTHNPARSCVAVHQLPKGALVEVEVIAQAAGQ